VSEQALLRAALHARFGEDVGVPTGLSGTSELLRMAQHRSIRSFDRRAVEPDLLRLLLATALSSPSKSDLQQVDIVHVSDPVLQEAVGALVPRMPWVATAPVLLVVCGNGRRIVEACAMHGQTFANDHFDAVFNTAVDAGIVLSSLLHAAEAVGLGGCPVSVLRDQAAEVVRLLDLPARVYPVAGLCLGWPAVEAPRAVVSRLPLAATVHENTHCDNVLVGHLQSYDQRRTARDGQPAWSRAKATKYARAERADFGAFIEQQGFRLL